MSTGNVQFFENESVATPFCTDADGKITIENIKPGNYSAIEKSNPHYGYTSLTNWGMPITAGKQITYTCKNEIETGNLSLKKVDQDTTEAMKGVEFTLKEWLTAASLEEEQNKFIIVYDSNGEKKQTVTGEVTVTKMEYTEDESEATKFITDDNGNINIYNILAGFYYVEETSPLENYDEDSVSWDGEYITPDESDSRICKVYVERQSSLNTADPQHVSLVTIGNKRKYINLSGNVWLDRIDVSKGSVRNDLYNNEVGEQDLLLEGIVVKLIHNSDNTKSKETTTNSEGHYRFEGIEIDDLENYHIQFDYNGMCYIPVEPKKDVANGSKATEEAQDRTDFNNNYATITNNRSNAYDLTYKTENNQSTLLYRSDRDTSLYNYGNSQAQEERGPVNGVDDQYMIWADTYSAYGGCLDQIASPDTIRDQGIDEIENINLGLRERERPTIAVLKYIDNIRLEINGYNHTYLYGSRFKNAGDYENGFNVGVKFAVDKGASYTRTIYKADYEWENPEDRDKELKAYITYKIDMKNQSTNLTAQVNSMVDYFDSKYELIKVGTGLDSERNITGDISKDTPTSYSEKYKKVIISNNSKIEPNQIASIYVQFKLSREQVVNILKDKEAGEQADDSQLLNNVTEINSYSIFDKDGKVYAGIDTQSNPGNCTPGDKTTYENDTDEAPALRLEVADNPRQMTGKVFLDGTTSELKTAQTRQGNGAYDAGETGIQGVVVTLSENTEGGQTYTATTNSDGDFLIEGFLPGNYTLTYSWGDTTYTVQDYKGTRYNKARYTNNQANPRWWHDEANGTRYTDAIDNYNTDESAPYGSRKQIDAEIASGGAITREKTHSSTPTMAIGVEYETAYTASNGDRYTFEIKNIDFGIVERARQMVDIVKDVTGVKIALANGQQIVDAQIVNGQLQGEVKGLTYMPPANGQNGFVKVEMDNELIQGANIQIDYRIRVINYSELDYDSEDYYKYGIVDQRKLIKIKPEVYDYLDSQMVLTSQDKLESGEDNTQWEVVSASDYGTKYSEPTLVEKDFESGKTTDENGVIIYEWANSNEEYEQLIEWAYEVQLKSKPIRDVKLDNKTILHNANLEKELAPGSENSVALYASKVLSNTGEIDLNNSAEIVKTKSESGRGTDKIKWYDSAEHVTVTPPTGENQNYLPYILVGITSFIVLATGVVVIKKKVIG